MMKIPVSIVAFLFSAGNSAHVVEGSGTAQVTMTNRKIKKLQTQTRSLIANCPGDAESFSVEFGDACNAANLKGALEDLIDGSEGCAATADELLRDLLGITATDDLDEAVRQKCIAAYANSDDLTHDFGFISRKGEQFDNEYYSGGTYWNYEVETNDGENRLRTDARRVKEVYDNEAQEGIIKLPYHLPAFDPDQNQCEYNAAFCCWVQDRQARDNNGNCNTPYESNCIDKDPADNANLCYVEHARSSVASHVDGGFTIFGDVQNGKENIEGPIHCHGFAWAQDETDVSGVYRGNNLFYVSMYDHMHQRGYVRNVPGSSMCACAENMAVVTRADCTELAVVEAFAFHYDFNTTTLSGELVEANIEFNACQGANGNNNDLEAYYEQLVLDNKQTEENLEKLREVLVGNDAGECNAAILEFLEGKGINPVE